VSGDKLELPTRWTVDEHLGLTYVTEQDDEDPRGTAEAEYRRCLNEGYMLALKRLERFGDELTGDKALTDEESYILAQAAEILELTAPGREA
jgi:hypothetical protein